MEQGSLLDETLTTQGPASYYSVQEKNVTKSYPGVSHHCGVGSMRTCSTAHGLRRVSQHNPLMYLPLPPVLCHLKTSAPSCRSLMKMLNRTGSSIDPWRMPLVTGLHLDVVPLITSHPCGLDHSTSFQCTPLTAHPACTSTACLQAY